MEIAVRVLVSAGGLVLVAWTVLSAIKTVILPRASASTITRAVFLATRQLFRLLAPPRARYERRDRVLASYAPISLIATLAAWLALTMAGFVLIFMGVDVSDGAERWSCRDPPCSRSASGGPKGSRARCSSSRRRPSVSSCWRC